MILARSFEDGRFDPHRNGPGARHSRANQWRQITKQRPENEACSAHFSRRQGVFAQHQRGADPRLSRRLMRVKASQIILNGANTSSSKAAKGDEAFLFAGQNADVVANSVSWFESDSNTIVQADVNGNTTADLTIVLTGLNHNLIASDFIL
jgi:hypothetical protein